MTYRMAQLKGRNDTAMGWAATCVVQRGRHIQSYTPNSPGAQCPIKIAVNLPDFQTAVEALGRRSAVGETLRALVGQSRAAELRITQEICGNLHGIAANLALLPAGRDYRALEWRCR